MEVVGSVIVGYPNFPTSNYVYDLSVPSAIQVLFGIILLKSNCYQRIAVYRFMLSGNIFSVHFYLSRKYGGC